MAKYISGVNRNQLVLFPDSIDDFIDEDNDVRFIDAFVDSLDLASLGFSNASLSSSKKGAPSFEPRVLLKIYLYSYPKKIRSSRRIAAETKRNIELMWLTGRLSPDFRTISDFRKNNSKPLKNVLTSFTNLCLDLKLFSKDLVSLDGSKFKAVNSKDNNFTKDKLVDRIKRIENNISNFLSSLDSNDSNEASSDSTPFDSKLDLWNNTIDKYISLLNQLVINDESQISLTDPSSKLMKCNGNMLVGYNVQVVSDTSSHIITDFSVSNSPNDNGKILDSSTNSKDILDTDLLYVLADGGYKSEDDLKNCFDNKIVPILPEGVYSTTYDFVDSEITQEIKKGDSIQDVQTCLRAGVIPDCYSDLNLSLSIKTETSLNYFDSSISSMTDEQRLAKAKLGYFVRSSNDSSIFCPQGFSLSYRSSNKYNDIFVGNSFCQSCPKKCTKEICKKLSIKKNVIIQGTSNYKTVTPKFKPTKTESKIVVLTYIPDKEKYKLRKNTSEHPFGTLKRAHDASYFLTKGVDKVTGEMALSVLGYNFKRIIKIVGVKKLIEHLNNKPVQA